MLVFDIREKEGERKKKIQRKTWRERTKCRERKGKTSEGGKTSYKSAMLEQGSRDATDPLIHIEPDCTSQFASPFKLLRLFVTI